MSQDNTTKLKEIVAILLDVEAECVTLDTSPETVEHWDSVNHISICTAINQEFSVSMTMEEMTSTLSVAQFISLLSSKGISFD